MQNLIINKKDEIITELILQRNKLTDLSMLDGRKETITAIRRLTESINLIHLSK